MFTSGFSNQGPCDSPKVQLIEFETFLLLLSFSQSSSEYLTSNYPLRSVPFLPSSKQSSANFRRMRNSQKIEAAAPVLQF